MRREEFLIGHSLTGDGIIQHWLIRDPHHWDASNQGRVKHEEFEWSERNENKKSLPWIPDLSKIVPEFTPSGNINRVEIPLRFVKYPYFDSKILLLVLDARDVLIGKNIETQKQESHRPLQASEIEQIQCRSSYKDGRVPLGELVGVSYASDGSIEVVELGPRDMGNYATWEGKSLPEVM